MTRSKLNHKVWAPIVFLVIFITATVMSSVNILVPVHGSTSSGPNNGSTFTSSNTNTPGNGVCASYSQVSWSNPSNAQTSNDGYATGSTSSSQYSYCLKATGFNFAIPSSATIEGVMVEYEIKASSANPPLWICSSTDCTSPSPVGAYLYTASVTGNQHSVPGTGQNSRWNTADEYASAGGASDLWGMTLTPAIINSAGFGVFLLTYYIASGGSVTASVDHVRITVYYSVTVNVNTKIVAADGSMMLSGAQVTMNNGTDQTKVVTCGTSCWANYTGISTSTVTIKVQWRGSYVNGTFTLSTTTNQTITVITKVYQSFALAFRFNDNSTAFTPTQAKVTAPNGTSVTLSSYTLGLVQNGTWTVTQISYWGNNVVPNPNPTFIPTGNSQSKQIAARIYQRNLLFYYNDGVTAFTPTQVKYNAPNSTSITLTSYINVWIQNGTSTFTKIGYWGNNMVPTSATFDASGGNPSVNARIYSRSFTFYYNDAATAFTPSSIKYTAPNGTTITRTSYSSIWIQNGTSTVIEVQYWGNDVVPAVHPTFDATTGNPTLSARIYSTTPTWQDAGGTVLYANPSTYKWTAPNGTLVSGLVGGTAYWVQNGTTAISQITWKGTANMAIVSGGSFDGTSGNPTVRIAVYALTLNAVDQSALAINVTFIVTFPNSTQTSFTSNNTGFRILSQVQNGTYSVTTTWLSLQVAGPTAFNITTANKAQSISAFVYYTAVNGFRSAVDQGTLASFSSTVDTISFTATASGNRTAKVYVGNKGVPTSVWLDGTKLTSGQYTYDHAEMSVGIATNFVTTHTIAVLWTSGVPAGPSSGSPSGRGGSSGLNQILAPVTQVGEQIVEIAKGNPWIFGVTLMIGLFGGAVLAYRNEHERVGIFLAGMGVFLAIDAGFVWGFLPVSLLKTNLSVLPVTLDKLLIQLPSVELPTALPSGEELARGFVNLTIIGLASSVIASLVIRD